MHIAKAREPLSGYNLAFVETLYANFLQDPASVESEWRAYFEDLNGEASGSLRALRGPSFRPSSIFNPPGKETPRKTNEALAVAQLIEAYRLYGHKVAQIDPLGSRVNKVAAELEFSRYGLKESALEMSFPMPTLAGERRMTLREIIELMQEVYCQSVGVQLSHIDDPEMRRWLQLRLESQDSRGRLTRQNGVAILSNLIDAEIFENFLQNQFVGAKRFSLEGAESIIPLLELAFEEVSEKGVAEVVIGMAHRGRLNILANVMKKSARHLFREFEDADADLLLGRGDVKYHKGCSSDRTLRNGRQLHLTLCFNPSHLEFVGPVVLGRVRAKQDRRGDEARSQVLPLIIHGDAAFAGQGIAQEMLNLSELQGYKVGGALHVILNNQIGFTTPPSAGRSCAYASDVARMLQIPIFHVNGEDLAAMARVVKLAVEFRQTFQRDVVIDMLCYRRYGHNEGDEPSFTQPLMYAAIRQRRPIREIYAEKLIQAGELTRQEAEEIARLRRQYLENELSEARNPKYEYHVDTGGGIWKNYYGGSRESNATTALTREQFVQLMLAQTRWPAQFHPHPKIVKLLEVRRAMAEGKRPLDWGAAESLAFASLLVEGTRIRLSGQDIGRGTFSHRHAVLHDVENGQTYIPLAHLAEKQGIFEVYDSPLSEAGVLAFDFGYSLDYPDGLVIWEAQFGDFANGAQVIIDQFIVSSEDKWARLSGLVLLLPHGLEGQGPEHSSARLERFLMLANCDNIQVINPTTPAQIFHGLRRQMLRPWRKPLVVMSPKSLLRHPHALSTFDEFTQGTFQRVIADQHTDPGQTRRVVLCSGKIYYELIQARTTTSADRVAIVRLEQLYPFPENELQAVLAGYPAHVPLVWVQEEPANMGAWPFLRLHLAGTLFGRPLSCVSRPESSSPATGSAASHRLEQELLLEEALGEEEPIAPVAKSWLQWHPPGNKEK